jgi:type IV pilus assembly protein PilA
MLELFMSLLIIGILIASAIPVYQSYFERAKITEAISLMGGAKSNLAEYYSYYGYFPDNLEQHGVKTKGEYTTHITIDNGAMTATLASGNQDVNGFSLSLRPALAENDLPKVITWACGYAQPPARFIIQAENQTNIPRHYLSLICRNRP